MQRHYQRCVWYSGGQCVFTPLHKFCRLLNLIFPIKSHSFGEKKIIFHAHWFLVNSFCISCSFSFKNLELCISAVFKKFFALRCKEFISYCISKNTVYPMQLKIVLLCTFDNKFFIQWKTIIPLFHSICYFCPECSPLQRKQRQRQPLARVKHWGSWSSPLQLDGAWRRLWAPWEWTHWHLLTGHNFSSLLTELFRQLNRLRHGDWNTKDHSSYLSSGRALLGNVRILLVLGVCSQSLLKGH